MRQSDESDLKLAQLEHKRKAMEARIEAMRAEFEADSAAVKKAVSLDDKREKRANRQSIGDGEEPQSQRQLVSNVKG